MSALTEHQALLLGLLKEQGLRVEVIECYGCRKTDAIVWSHADCESSLPSEVGGA